MVRMFSDGLYRQRGDFKPAFKVPGMTRVKGIS